MAKKTYVYILTGVPHTEGVFSSVEKAQVAAAEHAANAGGKLTEWKRVHQFDVTWLQAKFVSEGGRVYSDKFEIERWELDGEHVGFDDEG